MKDNQTVLLLVFAHPDDESFAVGGVVVLAARRGIRVVLLLATRGEAGVMHGALKAGREELREIRAKEAAAAARILGIKHLKFLGFQDGTLAAEEAQEGQERILGYLKSLRPDIVMTFGPDGVTGHSDHRTVSSWTTGAFKRAHKEHLLAKKARLYWVAAPEEHFSPSLSMIDNTVNRGIPMEDISTIVDIAEVAEQKHSALLMHKSQQNDVDWFLREYPEGLRKECFRRVQPPWQKEEGKETWVMGELA